MNSRHNLIKESSMNAYKKIPVLLLALFLAVGGAEYE